MQYENILLAFPGETNALLLAAYFQPIAGHFPHENMSRSIYWLTLSHKLIVFVAGTRISLEIAI